MTILAELTDSYSKKASSTKRAEADSIQTVPIFGPLFYAKANGLAEVGKKVVLRVRIRMLEDKPNTI